MSSEPNSAVLNSTVLCCAVLYCTVMSKLVIDNNTQRYKRMKSYSRLDGFMEINIEQQQQP